MNGANSWITSHKTRTPWWVWLPLPSISRLTWKSWVVLICPIREVAATSRIINDVISKILRLAVPLSRSLEFRALRNFSNRFEPRIPAQLTRVPKWTNQLILGHQERVAASLAATLNSRQLYQVETWSKSTAILTFIQLWGLWVVKKPISAKDLTVVSNLKTWLATPFKQELWGHVQLNSNSKTRFLKT